MFQQYDTKIHFLLATDPSIHDQTEGTTVVLVPNALSLSEKVE